MPNEIREFDSLIDLLEDLEKDGITGYQKQREFKRFLNLMARMRGTPNNGGFELTPLCTFDCKMCYVHLTKDQMEKEAKLLTTAQWIDIMGQAIDAGMLHAELTGGECLSYPGFKDVYRYLFSRGVEVTILTNGQLVSEEMADFFAQYRPKMVQITIYGSNEDAYERVTGRRAFFEVKSAIERLKKRGIPLFLPITPNPYMQEDIHALLEFLRSVGVQYAIGTGSLPARPSTERFLDNYAVDADLYVKLQLDEQEYQKKVISPASEENQKVIRIPKNFELFCEMPCSSGQSTFHVNWMGEMQPCIPFYTVTKSILKYGFNECWAWIKEQMKSYKPPQECQKCPNVSVCTSCPAERTLGILNGPVNKYVCERNEGYVQAGILNIKKEQDCIE